VAGLTPPQTLHRCAPQNDRPLILLAVHQIKFLKGGNMPADVGDVAPDFTLPSVSQGDISLGQYRGDKNVVLSFHVFNFTSG
jgi:AhpC/TSA family protein